MTTNRKQTERLLIAGYPGVAVGMKGHHIVLDPIPLYRLWDDVHRLMPAVFHFSTNLTSVELIESLVSILENHYRNESE